MEDEPGDLVRLHHQPELPDAQPAAARHHAGVRGPPDLEELPRSAQHLQELPHAASVKEGKTLVLIIDEAQTLTGPLLELLRQLMNYESNDQKFMQVVLFAQEEFRGRLQHPRYRNLVNRAAMSSTLDPLSPSRDDRDAEAPLARRRRRGVAVHRRRALPQLYAHSHGIPRTQVILADNALAGGLYPGGQDRSPPP